MRWAGFGDSRMKLQPNVWVPHCLLTNLVLMALLSSAINCKTPEKGNTTYKFAVINDKPAYCATNEWILPKNVHTIKQLRSNTKKLQSKQLKKRFFW